MTPVLQSKDALKPLEFPPNAEIVKKPLNQTQKVTSHRIERTSDPKNLTVDVVKL